MVSKLFLKGGGGEKVIKINLDSLKQVRVDLK